MFDMSDILSWTDLVLRFLLIFLLFAGAEAGSPSAIRGAFTFCVDVSPSWGYWNFGSANMLLAGACVDFPPIGGGALSFDVTAPPSGSWWGRGSAFIYIILIAGAGAHDPSSWGGALSFFCGRSSFICVVDPRFRK